MDLVREGKSIAIVSDAGMPGISDPGQELIRRCIEKKSPYFIAGGKSALTVLCCQGYPLKPFAFEGFYQKKPSGKPN